ncbi:MULTISPECIES: hypothetical protein [unclassified Synechococcus]|uniref:hypothetical protein n=1 Tax=unclassified Synechococcus TaxID=2626047 RepID=UPI0039B01C21
MAVELQDRRDPLLNWHHTERSSIDVLSHFNIPPQLQRLHLLKALSKKAGCEYLSLRALNSTETAKSFVILAMRISTLIWKRFHTQKQFTEMKKFKQ